MTRGQAARGARPRAPPAPERPVFYRPLAGVERREQPFLRQPSPRVPRKQQSVTAVAAAAAAHLLSTAGPGGGPDWREVVLERE